MKHALSLNGIIVLMFLLFSCSSKDNNTPTSIEHAECLMSFAVNGSNGDEVRFEDYDEDWVWTELNGWNICQEQGFTYKIEYSEGDLYVINMLYSSTGSGEFTSLMLVESGKDGFKLIDLIAGGDRCQHGIYSDEVIFENDCLIYSTLITPFHLMSWNDRTQAFGTYDDCMVCCVGAAKYKYNLKTKQNEFISIKLLLEDVAGDDDFSRTYRSFIQEGKKVLNESDIQNFINRVESK